MCSQSHFTVIGRLAEETQTQVMCQTPNDSYWTISIFLPIGYPESYPVALASSSGRLVAHFATMGDTGFGENKTRDIRVNLSADDCAREEMQHLK